MFWSSGLSSTPRSSRLFNSAHISWSNLICVCVCVCVCTCVCVYGAMPRSKPAGQLGAMGIVCCIPGGDIFNDCQTEPWVTLRPTGTNCSLWKPTSLCTPVIFILTYTLAAQDLTPYDLWIQNLAILHQCQVWFGKVFSDHWIGNALTKKMS